jgi:hypothetical protein
MADEVKNKPQLRIGFINERLSEGMFIRLIRALWRFFHFAAILLLCRDAKCPWDTQYFRRTELVKQV